MKYRCFSAILLGLAVQGISLGASADASDDFYYAIRGNDLARLNALVRDGADVNSRDRHGSTPLMDSATVGSLEAMKFLLSHGADVNAQNQFGSTALVWSATDLSKVSLLLSHGADPNIATKRGRTVLLVAAMSDRSAEIARLLIEKGANPKVTDAFKTTALRAAAMGNDDSTMRMLIEAGVDVNAGDLAGITPLMMAAGWNGNLRAVELLLAYGARVNAVSAPVMGLPSKNGPSEFGKMTALLMSAPFGPPDLLRTLLDAGADVNARDVRGMTPLMLAIATDRQDEAVIRMMLEHGADTQLKNNSGETASDWARRTALRPATDLLKVRYDEMREAASPAVAAGQTTLETATGRTLALIEKASWQFFANSGCVSCHAQSMTDMAVGLARAKGIRVDENAARERAAMLKAIYVPELLLERMDPAGAEEQLAYPLAGLALNAYPPDQLTDAMVANIASTQGRDGSWHVGAAARPPAEEGDIFRTALCIRALTAYGPPGRGPEMAERVAQARRWLRAARAVTAEDRNMQLLGLYWAGDGDARLTKRLADAILVQQLPDGGWRQRDGLPTDAYATGESLYALAEAGGAAPASAAYRKGIQFLLRTQHADASWFVPSRSPRIQAYFEGGFPYGPDQWISSWATAWAAMAMIKAVEPTVTRASR
jgi:N-acyl-D-amino-acid deacylase